MAKFKILRIDETFEVPSEVAKCPICGSKLFASFEEWNHGGDGLLIGVDVHLDCEAEPDDINSQEWKSWFAGHYQTPYVYWLPVCIAVEKWTTANFRFCNEKTDAENW